MDYKRQFLFDILPKNCVCAEIGVWKGDFSQEILDHLNPKKLFLVDQYKFEPLYKSSLYGGLEAKNQKDMNNIHWQVAERFKINSFVVKMLILSSAEASTLFSDNYFDFVYIDSCHLYEFVKQDLELWFPKIKNKGILCGDDYSVIGWWNNGIQKAVDEFININNLQLEVKNNQFIIRKEI